MNITYVDAVLADRESEQAEKFLASQAVQYALPGVPATYIHSLLGSRNWYDGVRHTGRARTINREKLQAEEVVSALQDPNSFRSRVFAAYIHLIKIRKKQPAFHPNAPFEILDIDPRVFAIKRQAEDQTIYALTNLSSQRVHFLLSDAGISGPVNELLTDEVADTTAYELKPYQYVWLTPSDR